MVRTLCWLPTIPSLSNAQKCPLSTLCHSSSTSGSIHWLFRSSVNSLLPAKFSNYMNICSLCDVVASASLLTVKLACLFSYLSLYFALNTFCFHKEVTVLYMFASQFTMCFHICNSIGFPQQIHEASTWIVITRERSFYLQTCPPQFLLPHCCQRNRSKRVHLSVSLLCLKPFSVDSSAHRFVVV